MCSTRDSGFDKELVCLSIFTLVINCKDEFYQPLLRSRVLSFSKWLSNTRVAGQLVCLKTPQLPMHLKHVLRKPGLARAAWRYVVSCF